jgi:hypothetical protein
MKKRLITYFVVITTMTTSACQQHYSIVKVEMNAKWTSRDSVWVLRSVPKTEYRKNLNVRWDEGARKLTQ